MEGPEESCLHRVNTPMIHSRITYYIIALEGQMTVNARGSPCLEIKIKTSSFDFHFIV